MIRFIGQCSYLVFGIIGEILNIPITLTFGENTQEGDLLTFGVVLIITIMIGLTLKFMFGGKGD